MFGETASFRQKSEVYSRYIVNRSIVCTLMVVMSGNVV